MGESCSHIAALLFKIEAAVRLGYTSMACTLKPCKWNNDFVSSVKGEKIRDILFHKAEKKVMVNYSSAAATEKEKNALLSKLHRLPSNKQPLAISLFSKYSGAFHHKQPIPSTPKLPKSLRDLYCTSSVGQKEDTSMVYEEHITEADIKCNRTENNRPRQLFGMAPSKIG